MGCDAAAAATVSSFFPADRLFLKCRNVKPYWNIDPIHFLAFSGQRSVKKQVLPIAIGMIYPYLHQGKEAARGNVLDYSLKFRVYG